MVWIMVGLISRKRLSSMRVLVVGTPDALNVFDRTWCKKYTIGRWINMCINGLIMGIITKPLVASPGLGASSLALGFF